MTGSLRVRPAGDVGDAYVRAWWALDGGGEALEYRDVRRFGRLAVAEGGRYAGTLAVQGPDALDRSLDAEEFWRSLRASRRAVKTQLLSQRPIAGVGNIYADEALWRARVHPARRTVTRAQAAALLDAVARRPDREPALRRHDAVRLPHGRGAGGPQPAAARRVRAGRAAVPAVRHRAAVAHARRPHGDVVPHLPAPLTGALVRSCGGGPAGRRPGRGPEPPAGRCSRATDGRPPSGHTRRRRRPTAVRRPRRPRPPARRRRRSARG